ncbi:MAG: PorV/PorQ family protein [Elusimicrobiota bacterium]
MLERAALLMAAALFISGPAFAAAGPGTSAAEFLQMGYGARAIGFGEAFVPVANDVSALYYNPAGLAYPAFVDPKSSAGPYEVMMSQSLLVQGVNMTQLGYVRRPFGLSLTYLSVGGIEQRTTETAAPDATGGASDMSLGGSYAQKIDGVGVGVTGRYIREAILGYSASAFGFDVGALKHFDDSPLSLGMTLTNVGTDIRFLQLSYPLPTTISAGASYGMTKSFPHAFVAQFDLPRNASPDVRLGFEYRGFGPIALRAGYRTFSSDQRAAALGTTLGSTASGLTDFYGLSLGAGLRTVYGDLDVAMVPSGELGTAYRMSYSCRFGGPKPVKRAAASEAEKAAAAAAAAPAPAAVAVAGSNAARIAVAAPAAPAARPCVDPADPSGVMVPVGEWCVDKYEASVWSTATGGAEYGISSDDYPCTADGATCAKGQSNAIYARSVKGVKPSASINWYRAAAACRNAGKELLPSVVWKEAAAGTPESNGGDQSGVLCNTDGLESSVSGVNAACVSAAGVENMVGSVWEWVAEQGSYLPLDMKGHIISTDLDGSVRDAVGAKVGAMVRGGSWDNGANARTTAVYSAETPLYEYISVGFRCGRHQ